MIVRCASVLLLLYGIAIAQESTPIDMSGKDHPPTCRGKASDAPGCITAPHATYAPDADYPEKARRAKDRGVVLVDLVVGTDGLPHDVKIFRGATPALDQAAIDAVKRWKFTPAAKDGHPVAVQTKVEVSFKLY